MKSIEEIRQITKNALEKKNQLDKEEVNLEKEKIAFRFRDFELQMGDFIEDVFKEIEIRASNGFGYVYSI